LVTHFAPQLEALFEEMARRRVAVRTVERNAPEQAEHA
jgi:hypothetical protein